MWWCVVYVCVRTVWRVDLGSRPYQQVARAWVLSGWRSSWGLVFDCWHAHTGLSKITDVGLHAFADALSSSTTITTVELSGKSEWLVILF